MTSVLIAILAFFWNYPKTRRAVTIAGKAMSSQLPNQNNNFHCINCLYSTRSAEINPTTRVCVGGGGEEEEEKDEEEELAKVDV